MSNNILSSNTHTYSDDVLNIIKSQTSIYQDEYIKNALDKNNGSISDTIIYLMNYKYCMNENKNTVSQSNTIMLENIRNIVSEKENVFYELLNTNKKS